MCGIGGTVGIRPDPTVLEQMAQTMRKRGPDGQATWHDEYVGLAFRRLAIIDLHERSSQPQHLGALHLTFNGEIYNYRELREELERLGHAFATEGDAEVLLHAWAEWREHALDRVNGMFALAIWDEAHRRLVLASDPFGEKPLYYARVQGGLVWASELAALHDHPHVPRTADHPAVAAFLALGWLPAPETSFFAGIERLPGSHLLEWTPTEVRVRRYWTPAPVDVPDTYEDATAELRRLLTDSIRLRVRSDVPVGTSLSGGIDSSLIVALTGAIAPEATHHAFTATFPGDPSDEWHFACDVASHASVAEHHAVEPTVHDLFDDLERLVRDHEEPFASLSVYAQWRVNRAAAETGVTVLLDGQGGDELFAGYPAVAGHAVRGMALRNALTELRWRPDLASHVGRSIAVERLPDILRREVRLRTASPYAAELVVSEAAQGLSPCGNVWRSERKPLRRELLTESFCSSLPHLLRYADRSSMAWSREVRLPLLDRRIAALALSLPAEYLYRGGMSKRILRDAGRGAVPSTILERRDKVGFEPPQRRWLETPVARNGVAEILLDRAAASSGLYNLAAIERDLRSGSWRDPDGLWRAVNVEVWRQAGAARGRLREVALQTP
jgi:asparagine synthase (glutamine-hydrolysing)